MRLVKTIEGAGSESRSTVYNLRDDDGNMIFRRHATDFNFILDDPAYLVLAGNIAGVKTVIVPATNGSEYRFQLRAIFDLTHEEDQPAFVMIGESLE